MGYNVVKKQTGRENMSILSVEHLTHGFGDRAIFDDVSFRLLAGEHIGLVGANGEGKSTSDSGTFCLSGFLTLKTSHCQILAVDVSHCQLF